MLTTPATIQDWQLSCPAPDVYNSDIVNGTQIQVTVVPSTNNPSRSQFKINSFNYTKNSVSNGASFQDSNGNFYVNILRYSCYQNITRAMMVHSKVTTSQSNSGASGSYAYASQFCVASGSGGGSPDGCPPSDSPQHSAQANYFNLYIRSSESGDINGVNSQFTCPKIKEPLNQAGYWPLDATFALSLAPSVGFTVGVVAQTQLANGVSASSSCYPTGTTSSGSNAGGTSAPSTGMISTCLGFASIPNPNGTCPSFRDQNQVIHPTFRLRRYVAIYPLLYDSSGKPLAGTHQGLDTIYVLDRPVSGNNLATIAGPKPCPFAYFDRMAVTAPQGPGYVATNNSAWTGKNVDGTQFPNIDGNDYSGWPSCSTSLIVPVTSNGSAPYLAIQTINRNNTAPGSIHQQYIRPIQAFTPNYIEDTAFRACAPQASPFQDPPLHFARPSPTSQAVAWCAEAYPTQNDNLVSLDPPFTYPSPNPSNTSSGVIAPFTSHTVKNTTGNCNATALTSALIPKPYPPNGIGNHPSSWQWDTNGYTSQTCDRTIINQNIGGYTVMPLLARTSDVETALINTPSYQCSITYDPTGGKTFPSGGCCGSANVSPTSTNTSSHLEPSTACTPPNY